MDGELAEHLAIDRDPVLGQAKDEPAVLDIALRASGGDPRDPEPSEVPLLRPSVAKGVLPRLHHLLVGAAENVLLATPITGGRLHNFLVTFVAHQATFNSCHLYSSFAFSYRFPIPARRDGSGRGCYKSYKTYKSYRSLKPK